MGAAHGALAVMGQAWGAHSPLGLASQGRRRMIGRGRGGCDTEHTAPTWVTAPGVDGARLPDPWGSAPGHRPRGWGGERANRAPPGTGVQGISRGPPRLFLMPLEGKGGPEVQKAEDLRSGAGESP